MVALFLFWVTVLWVLYHYSKGIISGFRKKNRELKQRLIQEEYSEEPEDYSQDDMIQEAIEAMVSLGYKARYSKQIIYQILDKENPTSTQDLVKAALRKCAA